MNKKEKRSQKGRYLLFSILFYAAAFYYINISVYQGNDYIETALFAFAALFVVFVLLLFNVHKIIFNFFYLPLKRLFKEAQKEAKKKKGKQTKNTFKRYRSIFAIILYLLISGLLVYSVVTDGVQTNEAVVDIVISALLTELIFLVIISSWQYLFYIIPDILDQSIDAKNGFILTLSAGVMVVFIVFQVFEIVYLAEIMIFILIIGFIALLGVNLNMIIGEINIFQNLRDKHNKTVTKVVFLVFFSFHIYVILYASVVAYSIYIWEPASYNFTYQAEEQLVTETLYHQDGEVIDQVYDNLGEPITTVYDSSGNEITEFYDEETLTYVIDIYDATDTMIYDFYDQDTVLINDVFDEDGNELYNYFYNDGSLAAVITQDVTYTYGDFLYYTIVTVSTLGYGDITPSYDYNIAQIWGGFLSMYGLTFFALSIGFVSNIAMEGYTLTREKDDK
ncbi:MAG: potassium channel family protein [Candidatus Izimaplasma sp.]|nr:potassium channel family protein [Candidatus Izimaplasma bacterium]